MKKKKILSFLLAGEKKTFKFHARGGSSRDEYVLHNISL